MVVYEGRLKIDLKINHWRGRFHSPLLRTAAAASSIPGHSLLCWQHHESRKERGYKERTHCKHDPKMLWGIVTSRGTDADKAWTSFWQRTGKMAIPEKVRSEWGTIPQPCDCQSNALPLVHECRKYKTSCDECLSSQSRVLECSMTDCMVVSQQLN